MTLIKDVLKEQILRYGVNGIIRSQFICTGGKGNCTKHQCKGCNCYKDCSNEMKLTTAFNCGSKHNCLECKYTDRCEVWKVASDQQYKYYYSD